MSIQATSWRWLDHATNCTRAMRWAEVIAEPLITTEQVMWEAMNALSTPAERPKAVILAEQLAAGAWCQLIDASPTLRDAGVGLFRERSDKQWSLTDCISFVTMQERQITDALAFDVHFEQAGFRALLRHEPPKN